MRAKKTKTMKNLQSSEQFEVGNNKIGWIGSNFKEHFGSMEFEEVEAKLETHTLEKPMLDKDILAEFKPQEATLGELLWAIQNPKGLLLENGYANIFYIRDKDNVLWAVRAHWHSGFREWFVNAYSVSYPSGWFDVNQVVSRKFGLAVGPLESWSLELEILEKRIKRLENFQNRVLEILNITDLQDD